MNKLASLKLAQKLQASNKRGIITGLVIAAVLLTLIVVAIIKLQWIKEKLGCCGDCDIDLDDEFDLDFDDDDALYTSEVDFV